MTSRPLSFLSPATRSPLRTRSAGSLALLCGVLAACGGESTDTPPDTTAATVHADTATLSAEAVRIAGFTVDSVRTSPWRAVVTVPGRLQLDPEAFETIGSITEGRITHVVVRVGDRVRAGQGLVFIHSHEIMDARAALRSAESAVEAADAERRLAESASDRAQRLFDSKAMSRAELERAQVARTVAVSAHARAVSERDRAAALVEHLAGSPPLPQGADEHDVITRTPIGGVVTSRDAQPGTVVLPGTPLLTVGDPSRLQLVMHVPESAAAGVQPGFRVRYTVADAQGASYEARVWRVAPTIDSVTRTLEVLARPSGPLGGRAESFVQAEISGEAQAPVRTVPAAAVVAFDGDTVVFRAEQRGEGLHLEATRVRVGRRTAERVEVLAGLDAGAAVLVQGAGIAKAELLRRRGGGGGGEH
ncbi:efflux RND transporter periplasmic adaptor subunit [Gemmatimonas sp. UBA7669]|uniref:efflux RND transporter periplasmic adaptor subunit n=1 Tax=Gemmatimonas sp. UBA7669 TaxID=1946568 RepID=UPI0025C0646C|nr:efflux RND transporter periplasmic adaptor subunit [Gemmatimonas sp. UBA7669]